MNLEGIKRDKLTIIKQLKERYEKNGCILYECLCECGRTTVRSTSDLNHNQRMSCGKCGYQQKIASENLKRDHKYTDLNDKIRNGLKLIDNTSIVLLKRKNDPLKNETSIVGVYYRKLRGFYYSTISFKGKKYYLGSSKDKNEAEKLYLRAKEMLHESFIKEYECSTKIKEEVK